MEKNSNKIYKALAEFQQSVGTISYDSKGYGYKYASLSAIIEHINPAMKKAKLGFYQVTEGETLKTVLFHTETGETIESFMSIPQGVNLKGMNDFQVLGSAITYLRRYSLASILGIVTDEDNDAQGEQTKPAPAPAPKQKPKLNSDQYQKTLEKLKNKEVTLEAIKQHFTVSKEQEEIFKTL